MPVKHPELFDALGIAQPKVPVFVVFFFLLGSPVVFYYILSDTTDIVGSAAVWAPRNWQDAVGSRRRSPH